MIDCSGFKDFFVDLIKQTQTTWGIWQAKIFLSIALCIFGGSLGVKYSNRYTFTCNVSDTRQRCLDLYSSKEDMLNSNLAMHFGYLFAPLLFWLIGAVLVNIVKKKIMDNNGIHSCHITSVYLVQLILRCLVFVGEAAYFFVHYKVLVVKPNFLCKLKDNASFGNSSTSSNIHCSDNVSEVKTILNFFYLSFTITFVIFGLFEIILLRRFLCSGSFQGEREPLVQRGDCSCNDLMRKLDTVDDQERNTNRNGNGAEERANQDGSNSNANRIVARNQLEINSGQIDTYEREQIDDIRERYRAKCKEHKVNFINADKEVQIVSFPIEEFAVKVKIILERQSEVRIIQERKIGESYYDEMKKFFKRLKDYGRHINIDDLFNDDEHRIVFIQGIAGIGKSFLAKQIAFKWANGDIYNKFSHVLFFECRDFNAYRSCNEGKGLDNLIEDFLAEKFSSVTCRNDSNVLFLIDGLDELKNKKSTIYKIISLFSKSKFIMLGRPHVQNIFTKCPEDIHIKYKVMEILGLGDEEIEDYIEKFSKLEEKIEKREDIKKSIKDTIDNSESLTGIKTVPQFLHTLCCVAILRNGLEISSVTGLYGWTFFLLLKQHLHQKNPGEERDDIRYLLSKYSSVIKSISTVAYKLYIDKKVIFGKKDLELLVKETHGFGALQNDFVTFFKETEGLDELQTNFFESLFVNVSNSFGQKHQFKHLTMMEFFASMYFYFADDRDQVICEFLRNESYECISFICCFEGRRLVANVPEDDILHCFVNEINRNRRATNSPVIAQVLSKVSLGLSFRYLHDTFKPTDRVKDTQFLNKLLGKIQPDRYFWERKREKEIDFEPSEVDQANIYNAVLLAKDNGISDKRLRSVFKGIRLTLDLKFIKVMEYVDLFDGVYITLNYTKISEDEMRLFAVNAIHCRSVMFAGCEFIAEIWEKLLQNLKDKESYRLQGIYILYMDVADGSVEFFAETLTRIETVWLKSIRIDEIFWAEKLLKWISIAKEKQKLKLKKIFYSDCPSLNDDLKRKIREAGVEVEEEREAFLADLTLPERQALIREERRRAEEARRVRSCTII